MVAISRLPSPTSDHVRFDAALAALDSPTSDHAMEAALDALDSPTSDDSDHAIVAAGMDEDIQEPP